MQPQAQHRSIRCRGFVRVRGGLFRRCGRVGARGLRADGGRGSSVHAVPRVANQPFTWSDITDFENLNVDKLFHEKEGPDRLSMLVETPPVCICFFLAKISNRL